MCNLKIYVAHPGYATKAINEIRRDLDHKVATPTCSHFLDVDAGYHLMASNDDDVKMIKNIVESYCKDPDSNELRWMMIQMDVIWYEFKNLVMADPDVYYAGWRRGILYPENYLPSKYIRLIARLICNVVTVCKGFNEGAKFSIFTNSEEFLNAVGNEIHTGAIIEDDVKVTMYGDKIINFKLRY